jgi:hypothetical protein
MFARVIVTERRNGSDRDGAIEVMNVMNLRDWISQA